MNKSILGLTIGSRVRVPQPALDEEENFGGDNVGVHFARIVGLSRQRSAPASFAPCQVLAHAPRLRAGALRVNSLDKRGRGLRIEGLMR